MKKRISQFMAIALLIALVIAVNHWVGWNEILKPWQTLPFLTILGAVILLATSHALRTQRLVSLFREDIKETGFLRFFALFRINALHTAMINFLPMRSGEVSFPYLMSKRFKVSIVHSSVALICVRAMDLHLLVLLSLISAGLSLNHPLLWAAAIIWAALLLLFFSVRKWFIRPVLLENERPLVRKISEAIQALPGSPTRFFELYFLGLGNWISKLAAFVIIFIGVTHLPIYPSLLALIAGDLSSSLPIHGVAGAGTYEAAIVLALAPFHVNTSLALTGAVNIHLFLLGYTCLQAGLFLLPLPNRRNS